MWLSWGPRSGWGCTLAGKIAEKGVNPHFEPHTVEGLLNCDGIVVRWAASRGYAGTVAVLARWPLGVETI